MQAPGPSALRFVNGIRKRGFLQLMGELWREYGDVFQVRLGPRTLIAAMHPDAVERINVTHRKHYDKLASYETARKYMLGQGLVTSTGELWRRQRKLMAPFFTPRAIRAYAELMIRDGERLQERWQGLARDGHEVEIAQEMTSVTASIILRSMFGSESMESIHQIKDAVETMITFVTARATGLPIPLWIPTRTNRRYSAARNLVHRAIGEIIARRRATDAQQWPDDLLSRWMNARDDETGEAMSETLLRDESITTFVAGHETTARTLTFAWYSLATSPHVAARLHAELDRVLAGRLPNIDDLRQLPYTLQVIKEVLRLYPAAPFYGRDAIEADQIGGFDVPAGAAMLLSPYYTHRHPQFWENPELFDPDRWAADRAMHGGAYHPFASGARVCIGNNFSLLETHLLLAILAQRFTPRLRAGYEARWEMRGVLNLAGGLPMVIAVRKPHDTRQESARPSA